MVQVFDQDVGHAEWVVAECVVGPIGNEGIPLERDVVRKPPYNLVAGSCSIDVVETAVAGRSEEACFERLQGASSHL